VVGSVESLKQPWLGIPDGAYVATQAAQCAPVGL
jgi:hypothetical protein